MTSSDDEQRTTESNGKQDTNGSDDELYDDDVEQHWGEASSVRGLDPSLLGRRLRRKRAEMPPAKPAAFSPWLIPVSAVLTGPIVAAVLAIFADGEPPSARQMVTLLSVGLASWAINMGLASDAIQLVSASMEATARIGVLFASGAGLWALYTYWLEGKSKLDRQGLMASAILLFVMSGLFWLGRDATWWQWLGR